MRKKFNRTDIVLFIGVVITIVICVCFIFPLIIDFAEFVFNNHMAELGIEMTFKESIELWIKALFSPFNDPLFNTFWILLWGTVMGVGIGRIILLTKKHINRKKDDHMI